MKYILILYILGVDKSALTAVEFNTEQACISALTKMQRKTDTFLGKKIKGMCVEKGKEYD